MLYVDNIPLCLFCVCISLPKAGEEEAGLPSISPYDDIFLSLFSSAFKHHTHFCIHLRSLVGIAFELGI
jgi:hypothetical protein